MPSEEDFMLIKGAVSPSGWALKGFYVLKAAESSNHYWKSAQEQGSNEDRVSIRTKAINRVREAFSLLPLPERPLPADFCDSTPWYCPWDIQQDAEKCQELLLVQNLIENWPSTNEPDSDFEITALRRSTPYDSGQPSAKRARLDGPPPVGTAAQGEVVVHQHASAGPSALALRGPRDANQPAAKAFFGLPELLSLLCTHLTYEKADLIVLSQVSKQVRAVVLPTLYSSVRVRLTKVDQLSQTLKANPGLIEFIRHLSIWDDAAHYHSRCNTQDQSHMHATFRIRSQVEPRLTESTWASFGDFLLAIQNRSHPSMPPVELSFGQMNLPELYDQLRRAPRLLQTLTALRIVDDFGAAYFKDLDRQAVESTYHDHGTTISEDISVILRLICEIQDDAGVDNFQTFEFEALQLETEERGSLLPMLPPRLLKRLAGRIRDLAFTTSGVIRSDVERFRALTDVHWSKLRRFRFYSTSSTFDRIAVLQLILAGFLRRHMHLVETDIQIGEYGQDAERRLHWVEFSLPHLVACHLSLEPAGTELQLGFANAHQGIRELAVTGSAGASALANHRAFTKSLRFLHAEPGVAEEFLRAGAAINHLDLDASACNEEGSRFPQCLYPSGRPATSITGLVLRFGPTAFPQISQEPTKYLPLHQLPNLVELSLKWTGGTVEAARDSPWQSARCLLALLKELAKHGAKLRTVCISYEAAGDLPCDSDLAQVAMRFPPKLEYLVWHVPFSNRTDHYRVLRPQATPPPSSTQVAQSSQSRLGQSTSSTLASETQPKVRLQRLPAIFRPKVDPKTGMWEDLDDEGCLSLFDHMGREPRLKCM